MEPENKNITAFDEHTEGCCTYKEYGTDNYLMIMDSYVKGGYLMQKTTDMVNFVAVDKDSYNFDFSPRHGSMLAITDEEYDRIESFFV